MLKLYLMLFTESGVHIVSMFVSCIFANVVQLVSCNLYNKTYFVIQVKETDGAMSMVCVFI